MKILIFGANGMLGHRLFIELSKHHEVYGTVRGEIIPSFADSAHIFTGVHALSILHPIMTVKPDVVINCIAQIPQRKPLPVNAIEINAYLPHILSEFCADYNARLIHFSTDAVFSGKRGNYTEDDTPDGSDTYALTKRLGEISDQEHVLTLRCCPIGRELNGAHSLVEWFLAQTGEVRGYSKSWFTPLTTHEIARILSEEILPNVDLHGTYHLSGDPINKFHLLNLLKMYYKHDIEIERDEGVVISRTLNSIRFLQMTEFNPISWERMITQMAADNALYEKVAI